MSASDVGVVAAELQEAVSPKKNVEAKEVTDNKSPIKRKIEDSSEEVEPKKIRQEESEEKTEAEVAETEATETEAPKTAEKTEEAPPAKDTSATEEETVASKVEEADTSKSQREKYVKVFAGLISKHSLPEGFSSEERASKVESLLFAANGEKASTSEYLTAGWTTAYNLLSKEYVDKIIGDIDEKFDFAREISEEIKGKIDAQVKSELEGGSADFCVESLVPSATV